VSRTTRKRIESFESYFLNEDWTNKSNLKAENQQRADYYGETNKWYSWKLPKFYRKIVTKKRRARDARGLFKEVHLNQVGNFCNWNAKSSESRGYW